MAHLEIQKKTGGASRVWGIVGLVILALLAWWILSSIFGTDRTAATDSGVVPVVGVSAPVAGSATAMGSADVVTDLSILTDTTNARLAGRRVALTGVPVLSAVSDKGFWAGQGNGATQSVFIVRGNQDSSYTAPNGAVVAGKRVNVWGTVQAMPADLSQQATSWNVNSTDKSRLATQKIYVQADSVQLAGR